MTQEHTAYCQRLLKNELHKRKEKNPCYSLRAFARDLGINKTSLGDLLSNKRNLSKRNLRKISASLELNSLQQAKLFSHSVKGSRVKENLSQREGRGGRNQNQLRFTLEQQVDREDRADPQQETSLVLNPQIRLDSSLSKREQSLLQMLFAQDLNLRLELSERKRADHSCPDHAGGSPRHFGDGGLSQSALTLEISIRDR